jgi:hypothetical protein
MSWLGGIAAGILIFFTVAGVHDYYYREGYSHGREDAENWGKEIDIQADEARKQIWREEARKGMWL